MASNISLMGLASRIVREAITNKVNGSRLLSGLSDLATNSSNTTPEGQNNSGGGWLTKVGGFLTGLIGGIGNIGKWIVATAISVGRFVWNFNWNASDVQLDASLNGLRVLLAGYLGGALGNLSGWLVCGAIPGVVAFQFNQSLGVKLLMDVGEEALDELLDNVLLISNTIATYWAKSAFINTYKNLRKFAKWVYADPQGWLYEYSKRSNSKFQENIRKWGENGGKPWTIASWVEEKVESIENEALQNFVEEFLEEFGESCQEALYVVASGVDDWVVQQQIERELTLGQERTVEIYPNREQTEERIILHGRESEIRTAIPLVLANHALVENRDVGQWVGNTVEEAVKVVHNDVSIQLQIHLSNAKQPPFNPAGNKKKRVIITVPNISRSKLDWANIKQAAGGANGYTWGHFLGKARLDTGHNIQLYASSPSECEDRIKALLLLSDSKLITLNITELKQNEGNRRQIEALKSPPTKIYPNSCTIVNRVKVLKEESGLATNSGIYNRRKSVLPLWCDTKPDDWEETINELFRIPGSNSIN